jgi:hypothetical protein
MFAYSIYKNRYKILLLLHYKVFQTEYSLHFYDKI